MKIRQAIRGAVRRWLEKLAKSNREQFGGVPPDCCKQDALEKGAKR